MLATYPQSFGHTKLQSSTYSIGQQIFLDGAASLAAALEACPNLIVLELRGTIDKYASL